MHQENKQTFEGSRENKVRFDAAVKELKDLLGKKDAQRKQELLKTIENSFMSFDLMKSWHFEGGGLTDDFIPRRWTIALKAGKLSDNFALRCLTISHCT